MSPKRRGGRGRGRGEAEQDKKRRRRSKRRTRRLSTRCVEEEAAGVDGGKHEEGSTVSISKERRAQKMVVSQPFSGRE